MSAVEIGLRSTVANAAEDLDTVGAVMVHIGNYVPNDLVQPDWFSWFGRQLGDLSAKLRRAAKEGDTL